MQGGEVGSLWQNSERTRETGSVSLCSAELGTFSPATSWHNSLMLCWPLQGCIISNVNGADITAMLCFWVPNINQAKLLTAFHGAERSPCGRATESGTENGQGSEKVLGHAPKQSVFYFEKTSNCK